jgi:hypothetical protein
MNIREVLSRRAQEPNPRDGVPGSGRDRLFLYILEFVPILIFNIWIPLREPLELGRETGKNG